MIKKIGEFKWLNSKKNSIRYSREVLNHYLTQINTCIDTYKCIVPHLGLIISKVFFKKEKVLCVYIELIALAVMLQLAKFVYPRRFTSGHFTVGYDMILPNKEGNIVFTIGNAIPLYENSGNVNKGIYDRILKDIIKKAEEYEDGILLGLFIRVYMVGMEDKELELECDDIEKEVWKIMSAGISAPPEVQTIYKSKGRRYPDYVTSLKPSSKERRAFIVADMETVLERVENEEDNEECNEEDNEVHVPYAAGFLVVRPGDAIGVDHPIDETYFSEDALFLNKNFKDRSNQMLFNFLKRLEVVASETKCRTVYFHNLSRFDGIILLKYLSSHQDVYTFKPMFRNNKLYELIVFRKKKRVFRFRDSICILPSSLDTLAKTLSPQLGSKGSIQHGDVQVSNLIMNKKELLEYMEQDIRLLGGVMEKAQEICWTQYKIDIEDVVTLSSLAIKIFRTCYYDPNTSPIYIPSRNQDTFIRRGYYGGHTDMYIPRGCDLYHYDVNSLYPYCMKTFPMPGGSAVWRDNLREEDISNLFGFFEAYVECPTTINRPFLPYRDENNTLLFPVGEFVGVYFSEELKHAQKKGYKIIPLRGYLYEKMKTPFESFVSSLYEKRKEAKKSGDDAMGYVYKLLMNSLYGRWGINPQSTITEVCEKSRYEYLTQRENLIFGSKLSDKYYSVSYKSNTGDAEDTDWNPPRIAGVHMAAATAAYGRIYMDPYTSRNDCYYTDTDSVILGSPLPEEDISSTELGKFKLENLVSEGIFLAPKTYMLVPQDSAPITKHKGVANAFVTPEWYAQQYVDPSRTEDKTWSSNFIVDRSTLNITKKTYDLRLGTKVGTKRLPVYDENNVWVGTQPKNVMDYCYQDAEIMKYLMREKDKTIESLQKQISSMQSETRSKSTANDGDQNKPHTEIEGNDTSEDEYE